MTTADTPKTFSSAQTFFMKVVFPLFWILTFGAVTLALWRGTLRRKEGVPTPESLKWAFVAMWAAGSSLLLWMCAGLKRVRADEKFLYVSNYLREIMVPLRAIADITENAWIGLHPVTVRFEEPTEFGERITFMPPTRLFAGWTAHPLVADLKERARLD